MANAISSGIGAGYNPHLCISPKMGAGTCLPGLVAAPDLSADDQVALLAIVDEAGMTAIEDLAAALPHNPRPVSAVLALVAAGVLEIERVAAIDGATQVRRTGRRRRGRSGWVTGPSVGPDLPVDGAHGEAKAGDADRSLNRVERAGATMSAPADAETDTVRYGSVNGAVAAAGVNGEANGSDAATPLHGSARALLPGATFPVALDANPSGPGAHETGSVATGTDADARLQAPLLAASTGGVLNAAGAFVVGKARQDGEGAVHHVSVIEPHDRTGLRAAALRLVRAVQTDRPPVGVIGLAGLSLDPVLHVVERSRRGRLREWRGLDVPGVYVGWSATGAAYVGMSTTRVGHRVATGPHLAEMDRIAIVTDRHGRLDAVDVSAAERILHDLLGFSTRLKLNPLPDGGRIAPERYAGLRAFIAAALAQLVAAGHIHAIRSLRDVIAGPREIPDVPSLLITGAGPAHHLSGPGYAARAIIERDRWVVLAGSTIRQSVVPSASATIAQRRAEGRYTGHLRVCAPDTLRLETSLQFLTASAAAQFVSGAKGTVWTPSRRAHTPGEELQHLRRLRRQ